MKDGYSALTRSAPSEKIDMSFPFVNTREQFGSLEIIPQPRWSG